MPDLITVRLKWVHPVTNVSKLWIWEVAPYAIPPLHSTVLLGCLESNKVTFRALAATVISQQYGPFVEGFATREQFRRGPIDITLYVKFREDTPMQSDWTPITFSQENNES